MKSNIIMRGDAALIFNINQRTRSKRISCLQLLLLWMISVPLISMGQNSCTFDGQTFQEGENVGNAVNLRCGSYEDWPCFCNPSKERQLDCPYCSFATGDGALHCARHMSTITFRDGSIVRECSCEIPDDPTQSPIRSCTILDDPVPPASSPIEEGSNGTCIFPNFDGDLMTFLDGESFGDLIEGVCGSVDEWPSFCSASPEGDGNDFFIDYPYCVFDDAVNGVVCAKHGEEIVYADVNGIVLNCTCTYSGEDGLQSTDCAPSGELVTVAPVDVPTSPPPPQAVPTPLPPTDVPGGTGTVTPTTSLVDAEREDGESGASFRKIHPTCSLTPLVFALLFLK